MDIKKFNVIGISVRTTNENGQSGKDITALWNRFLTEEISTKFQTKQATTFTAFIPIMRKIILDLTRQF